MLHLPILAKGGLAELFSFWFGSKVTQFLLVRFLMSTEAVKQIIDYLGMQPCERSDRVNPDKNSHALLLAGVFRGGHDVLVRTRLAFDQGVTMNITVRSDDAGVSEVILSAVG